MATIHISEDFHKQPLPARLRWMAKQFSVAGDGSRHIRTLMEEAAVELELQAAYLPGGKLVKA